MELHVSEYVHGANNNSLSPQKNSIEYKEKIYSYW